MIRIAVVLIALLIVVGFAVFLIALIRELSRLFSKLARHLISLVFALAAGLGVYVATEEWLAQILGERSDSLVSVAVSLIAFCTVAVLSNRKLSQPTLVRKQFTHDQHSSPRRFEALKPTGFFLKKLPQLSQRLCHDCEGLAAIYPEASNRIQQAEGAVAVYLRQTLQGVSPERAEFESRLKIWLETAERRLEEDPPSNKGQVCALSFHEKEDLVVSLQSLAAEVEAKWSTDVQCKLNADSIKHARIRRKI